MLPLPQICWQCKQAHRKNSRLQPQFGGSCWSMCCPGPTSPHSSTSTLSQNIQHTKSSPRLPMRPTQQHTMHFLQPPAPPPPLILNPTLMNHPQHINLPQTAFLAAHCSEHPTREFASPLCCQMHDAASLKKWPGPAYASWLHPYSSADLSWWFVGWRKRQPSCVGLCWVHEMIILGAGVGSKILESGFKRVLSELQIRSPVTSNKINPNSIFITNSPANISPIFPGPITRSDTAITSVRNGPHCR